MPPSPFCMTNYGEWDKFRNIDMDKEVFLLLLITKTSFDLSNFFCCQESICLNNLQFCEICVDADSNTMLCVNLTCNVPKCSNCNHLLFVAG